MGRSMCSCSHVVRPMSFVRLANVLISIPWCSSRSRSTEAQLESTSLFKLLPQQVKCIVYSPSVRKASSRSYHSGVLRTRKKVRHTLNFVWNRSAKYFHGRAPRPRLAGQQPRAVADSEKADQPTALPLVCRGHGAVYYFYLFVRLLFI